MLSDFQWEYSHNFVPIVFSSSICHMPLFVIPHLNEEPIYHQVNISIIKVFWTEQLN